MSAVLCVSKGLMAAPEIRNRYSQIDRVIEIPERLTHLGQVHYALDEESAFVQLYEARQQGVNEVQFALMYAVDYPEHENTLLQLAEQLAFASIKRTEALQNDNAAAELGFAELLHQPIAIIEQQLPVVVERCFQAEQGLELHLRWLEAYTLDWKYSWKWQQSFILRANEKLETPPLRTPIQLNMTDLLGVLLN